MASISSSISVDDPVTPPPIRPDTPEFNSDDSVKPTNADVPDEEEEEDAESSSKIVVNECVDDFDSLSGEYCGEWADATLKKLQMFGEKV